MKIRINGQEKIMRSATLEELLKELGHEATSVATAVNQEFVPIGQRAHCVLDDDDAIDIIAPMAGG